MVGHNVPIVKWFNNHDSLTWTAVQWNTFALLFINDMATGTAAAWLTDLNAQRDWFRAGYIAR